MKSISIQSLLNKKLNLLINDIKLNRKAILQNSNKTEYLHKFRISIRKIRVYLTYLSKYFQGDILIKCKKEFKYLGELTNEPRDLDVYIEKFDHYTRLLPKNKQNNLINLISYLKNKKAKEYKKLFKFLNSKIYKNIIKNITNQMKKNNLFVSKRHKASKVAYKSLSNTYTLIINKGIIINQNSLNSEFHKLRIDFKILRYLIELFLPFYKNKDRVKIIKKLKVIQTLLGNFNDYVVHGCKVKFFIKELNISGKQLKTLNNLIEKYTKEQNKIRIRFQSKFKTLNQKKFKQKLLNLK